VLDDEGREGRDVGVQRHAVRVRVGLDPGTRVAVGGAGTGIYFTKLRFSRKLFG
jgi:hypothetical protein